MHKTRPTEKKTTSRAAHAHGLNGSHSGLASRGHTKSHRSSLSGRTRTNIGLGAIAMGLASAATFLMLNPKKKSQNLKNFYNSYNNFKDEAEELAQNAYAKGKKAYGLATDYAENLRDTAYDVMEQPYSGSLILAGTIGGTLLGASLVYLLNRNQKQKNHNFFGKAGDVIESIKEVATSASENIKSTDWLDAAKMVLESLSGDDSHDYEDNSRHTRNSKNSDKIKQALELGLNGYRIWQNLKKKH